MKSQRVLFASVASISYFVAATPVCAGMAADDIERRTEELQSDLRAERLSAPEAAGKIAELEAAIERGKEASAGLREEIEVYKDRASELRETKNILASGLIGAIVTALVAIVGAFTNFRRTRAERDLKRLEVLEKANELTAKGIPLPDDIEAMLTLPRAVGS